MLNGMKIDNNHKKKMRIKEINLFKKVIASFKYKKKQKTQVVCVYI